jgi:hypothetical protein
MQRTRVSEQSAHEQRGVGKKRGRGSEVGEGERARIRMHPEGASEQRGGGAPQRAECTRATRSGKEERGEEGGRGHQLSQEEEMGEEEEERRERERRRTSPGEAGDPKEGPLVDMREASPTRQEWEQLSASHERRASYVAGEMTMLPEMTDPGSPSLQERTRAPLLLLPPMPEEEERLLRPGPHWKGPPRMSIRTQRVCS